MKTKSDAMLEWKSYTDLFNSGASRSRLVVAARGMSDKGNKSAALMNLGIMTPAEKRQIESRWQSINSVTEAEAALHCQFDGLPNL